MSEGSPFLACNYNLTYNGIDDFQATVQWEKIQWQMSKWCTDTEISGHF